MFLYCLICEKKYANETAYNDHLTRKQHRTKLLKLETIFSKNSADYVEWLKIRDESNLKRKTKKENES